MPTLTAKKNKLASELRAGSTAQDMLMHERIAQDRCMECGSLRDSVSEFCRACIDKSQKKTEVGSAFDAWTYWIFQCRPALPGVEAFQGWRIGVYERSKKSELICVCETFEETKSLVLKKYHRAGGYTYSMCA